MDSPVIDIGHEDLESEETFEESVFAPFGRFFDDDLFMLIYTNQGVLPANLRVLRNKLQVVSDRKIKKRSRAKAALHLGREVVKRAETRDALVSTDFSCAIKWFDLAIQLNSVEAAADVASLYLSKAKLELISDSDISLPEFKRVNSDGMSFDECCERAERNWHRGGRGPFITPFAVAKTCSMHTQVPRNRPSLCSISRTGGHACLQMGECRYRLDGHSGVAALYRHELSTGRTDWLL